MFSSSCIMVIFATSIPLLIGVLGKDICHPLPQTEYSPINSNSQMVSLPWSMSGDVAVTMLCLCFKYKHKESHANGLCPNGFQPLLTMKAGGEPMKFLGKEQHRDVYERIQFTGDLSLGRLFFHFNNVTEEDEGITFQLLAKLNTSTSNFAKCHKFTRYHLVKGLEPGKLTPNNSRNGTESVTTTTPKPKDSPGHDGPEPTSISNNNSKNGNESVTTTTPKPKNFPDKEENVGIIVGSCLGVVLALIIIVGLVIWFCRKNIFKHAKKGTPQGPGI